MRYPACLLLLLDVRFAAKTRRRADGCLEWTGAKSRGGQRSGTYYGSFNTGPIAGVVRAHVWVAWRAGKIPELRVPEGCHLDHECDDTLCVEKECIVLKPFEDNIARMWERRRERARARHDARASV